MRNMTSFSCWGISSTLPIRRSDTLRSGGGGSLPEALLVGACPVVSDVKVVRDVNLSFLA